MNNDMKQLVNKSPITVGQVCAVIVTYNRKEYLKKLMEGLHRQTYSLSAILIFDNCSSDGTDEMIYNYGCFNDIKSGILQESKNSDTTMYYYKNTFNSGGAGGFHSAIKIALNFKYEYLWIMDDDVVPEENCLEELMKFMSDEAKVCIPSRTDDKFQDYAITKFNMRNPFLYHITSRKTKIKSSEIRDEFIEVVDMPFEGPLFSISVIKEIGLPQKDFFIIFDDTEYARRASKITKIRYIPSAVLHKQIIPQQTSNSLMGWKDYYGYRNQIWYDRTYGENIFVRYMRPILLITELLLKAIIKRKWSNIYILHAAYRDGTHGNLGKTVDPLTFKTGYKG